MQFTMLIYENAATVALREDPVHAGPYWGSWTAYIQSLQEAGVMAGGNVLQPATTATTLRLRDGQRQVQDGPYAETKEQLGGFITLEVPDLDTALDWAARCPAAPVGAVEVRPVLPPMNG